MINISENDTGTEWQYEAYMHDYLLSLISTSTFEGRLKNSLEREINDTNNMSKEDYDRLVFQLYNNQLDRVTQGGSYNMGDIIKHLKKLK